jgi:signal transduction histidine kinase
MGAARTPHTLLHTAVSSPTIMVADDHVDTLASFPLFEFVPRAELDWLGARGDVHRLAPGATLREIGSSIDEMWIVLAGRVAVHVPKGGGGSWRRFYDSGPGYVLGAMPYSRMQIAPARLVAEDDTVVFALSRSHFPDLVRECQELTSALVHHMLDRARDYRTAQLHDERMQSLGRLAAGLAHELNNPASGAAGHARSLALLLDDVQAASRALACARLTDEQLEDVDAVRRMCMDVGSPRSPIEAADREEEFSDWLLRHDIDPLAASALATANVSVAALDHLADALPAETLSVAIRWAASDAAARQAATHIMAATTRIHALVSAVKGFTFMDREGVPDDVDIARGLADTAAMLESKSRAKSLRVRIETADDVPRVYGFGSELNQVWEKLIDNAIDAAPVAGNVTVTVTRRGDFVVVRVGDDGPGIPEEHRARIFDPFFTTKPVGRGTGLGLDIARRFAHLNDGDLDFSSQPGHTVFRVRLPVAGTKALAPRGAM